MSRNIILLSFIFLVLIFAVVSMTAIARRKIRPYYAAMEALAAQFPGVLSKFDGFFMNRPSFAGAFSGYKFSLSYVTDEASNVWSLHLVCHVASLSKLKIFMYDKNPGTVLFAERINLGDLDFDKYFIYSNRPDEARRYFADAAKIDGVRQLVAGGWRLPRITGKKIYTYSQSRPGPALDPEMLRTTLKNLIALRIEHI